MLGIQSLTVLAKVCLLVPLHLWSAVSSWVLSSGSRVSSLGVYSSLVYFISSFDKNTGMSVLGHFFLSLQRGMSFLTKEQERNQMRASDKH